MLSYLKEEFMNIANCLESHIQNGCGDASDRKAKKQIVVRISIGYNDDCGYYLQLNRKDECVLKEFFSAHDHNSIYSINPIILNHIKVKYRCFTTPQVSSK